MKKLIAIMSCLFLSLCSIAQTFSIKSAQVYACGTSERSNEIIRFKVGSTQVNVNDIQVFWPTGVSFRGIAHPSFSTAKIATINSTINKCGLILQPVSNILPPNADVLLIASTDFETNATSYANLTDTLYLICQNNGGSGDHLSHTGSGDVNLEMHIGPSVEIVAYSINSVAKVQGATVTFNPNGQDDYTSPGCLAPIEPSSIDAGSDTTVCVSSTVDLRAVAKHLDRILWSGGKGTFSNVNSANTTYIPSAQDGSQVSLYVLGTSDCDTAKDTIVININTPLSGNIITDKACYKQTDVIHLSSTFTAGNYEWQGGKGIFSNKSGSSTDYTISVDDNSGFVISLKGSNACGSQTITKNICIGSKLSVNNDYFEICNGQEVALEAFGAGQYTWSPATGLSATNVSNPKANPTVTTKYMVVGTTGSDMDTAYVNVEVNQSPVLFVSSDTTIAYGASVVLSASGATRYLWSPSVSLSCDTCTNPIATPQRNTTYSVLGISAKGCSTSKNINVIVPEIVGKVCIPNALTVSDNASGLLEVTSENIQSIDIKVFSRWGELVFNPTKNTTVTWDGKDVKGIFLPQGLYVYVVEATDNLGNKINKNGFISLR